MKKWGRETAYAVSAWLVPFVASVLLFGLKSSSPQLFDTLMGVVVSTSTMALGCAYLRGVSQGHTAQGLRIGVQWTLANWLLDGLMFSGGPMKMGPAEYATDIGLAYLAIPPITTGLGWSAATAARERAAGLG